MMFRWLPLDRYLLAILMTQGFAAPQIFASPAKLQSPWQVSLDLHSGFGVFAALSSPDKLGQDDPSAFTPLDQKGFPITIALETGYRYQSFKWHVDLGTMQLSAVDAPPATGDAQYRRYWLKSGISAQMTQLLLRPELSFELEYRLVDYINISAGHYVESVVPRLRLSVLPHRLWQGSVTMGVITMAEFGFHEGGKRRPLAPNEVSGHSLGLRVDYTLSPEARFFFGFDRESYQVQLANMSAYRDFGFNILPHQRRPHSYQLDTHIAQVGISRMW